MKKYLQYCCTADLFCVDTIAYDVFDDNIFTTTHSVYVLVSISFFQPPKMRSEVQT